MTDAMMSMIKPQVQTAMMQASQARAAASVPGKDVKNLKQIEEAAKDFEAMFLSEMLKPMFEGLEPDPVFGGGKGEEVFQGLMVQEYGKTMVEAGGIGLADHIKAEMIRMQEEMQK